MEGTDYRLPEHRRDVFLDFYEFHLRYGSHPGCVYYLMPYLRERYDWSQEQALWFAFINGNTQNPVTSLILHRRFPHPLKAEQMITWFLENYEKLAFDTDRRYHKKMFPQVVRAYVDITRNGQEQHWNKAADAGFKGIWYHATDIPSFGRLSAYSYSEYLRIMGVPFNSDTLMLDDISGSKSHRNGLCKVLGLDEYDWHQSNPEFDGKYSPELMEYLGYAGFSLLADIKLRAQGQHWEQDVDYFTLESALCTFKSWFRPNRRYANVYNDMLYDRIRHAENTWIHEDLDVFWDARQAKLPIHLRLEDNPHDPGCVPIKQNHFRLTGQVIMMNVEYPQYANTFNENVDAGRLPRRKK
jgi:hypothetical protein